MRPILHQITKEEDIKGDYNILKKSIENQLYVTAPSDSIKTLKTIQNITNSKHSEVNEYTNINMTPAVGDGTPDSVKTNEETFLKTKGSTGDHDSDEDSNQSKPNHSYISLIANAILSSAEKRLVLSDIYTYVLDNFIYFRSKGAGWRNSIRHNLSLNECFIKAGRSPNGKGHYWAINPANFEDFSKGDFRRRRAQRRARRAMTYYELPEQLHARYPNYPPTTSPSYNIGTTVRPHSAPLLPSVSSLFSNRSYETMKRIHSTPNAPTEPKKRKRAFDVESLLKDDFISDTKETNYSLNLKRPVVDYTKIYTERTIVDYTKMYNDSIEDFKQLRYEPNLKHSKLCCREELDSIPSTVCCSPKWGPIPRTISCSPKWDSIPRTIFPFEHYHDLYNISSYGSKVRVCPQ